MNTYQVIVYDRSDWRKSVGHLLWEQCSPLHAAIIYALATIAYPSQSVLLAENGVLIAETIYGGTK